MPNPKFTGGSDDFTIHRGLDGHRAPRHYYDEMSYDEVIRDIDNRRGLSDPTRPEHDATVDLPEEGDAAYG